MTEQELLAQLRDVHLPEQPGWWPPAIGWWLLAFVLITLVAVALFCYTRWRSNAWRREALREHRQLTATGRTPTEVVRELSVLMRRVAMKAAPRHEVASVTDRQWLSVLDRIGQTREYSDGVGKLLTDWPYRDLANENVAPEQLNSLFNLTRRTIERVSSDHAPGRQHV